MFALKTQMCERTVQKLREKLFKIFIAAFQDDLRHYYDVRHNLIIQDGRQPTVFSIIDIVFSRNILKSSKV